MALEKTICHKELAKINCGSYVSAKTVIFIKQIRIKIKRCFNALRSIEAPLL